MQFRFCPPLTKKVLTETPLSHFRGIASLAILLVLNTGCSTLPFTAQQLPNLLPNLSTDASLQLRVTPSNRAGTYTLAGSTNLPDSSNIAVAAVRYLRTSQQQTQSQRQVQTYSILAYQDVKVSQGKWQTTLNLWNVAPTGQFQEVWQLEQSKLGLAFVPETEVIFLATVAPTGSFSELERLLDKQGIKVENRLVYNTPEGERYIQARQVLSVALPAGQTTPLPPRLEEVNGGWGPRFLLIPEPPNPNNLEKPKNRRTDAPLAPTEFLQ